MEKAAAEVLAAYRMEMDRRDFMKGAAAVVALAGSGAALATAEPEFIGTRLLSVTLSAAYRGKAFLIKNSGHMPITIFDAPAQIVLAPEGSTILPDSNLKFA